MCQEQLVRRLRLAAILAIAHHIVWAITLVVFDGPPAQAVVAIQGGLGIILILVFAYLGPTRPRRTMLRIGEASVIVVIVLSSCTALLTGAAMAIPLGATVTTIAAAGFLPFGARPQGRIAVAAATMIVIALPSLPSDYPPQSLLTCAFGIGAALYLRREGILRRRQIHRALSALRHADEQLATSVARMPIAFWFGGHCVDCAYASPAFEEICGATAASVASNVFAALAMVDPMDRDRITLALRGIRESGFDEELRLIRPDGAVRHVRIRAYLLSDDESQPPSTIGLIEDISERHRAQEALTRCVERHDDLFDHIDDPVLKFDTRGHLIAANPAFGRLVGRPTSGLVGQHFLSSGILTRASRRSAIEIARQIAGGIDSPPTDLEISHTARKVPVEAKHRIIRDQHGDIAVEVTLHDLTESRRAAEAAQLRALAGHLDSAWEDWRKRLATRLHDQVAQRLAAARLTLRAAVERSSVQPNAGVADTEPILAEALAEVRNIMAELHPDVLSHFGLKAALESEIAAFWERTQIRCTADIRGSAADRTDPDAVAAFRTAQQALSLAADRGASSVHVWCIATDERISAAVEDDGQPFATSSVDWNVVAMRERVQNRGGNLDVESSDGDLNRITLTLPAAPRGTTSDG